MIQSERDIFAHQTFGQRLGFGEVPALLIVDFTIGFSDPAVFGGGNISSAVENTVFLLEKARGLGIPIVHTRIVYAADGSDSNLHTLKVPRLLELTPDNPASRFVPQLAPRTGETVIKKRLPSAFFGTDLSSIFTSNRVDTVVVAGCTTSGCVRASALDAICHGFRPMVARDCVGDRSLSAHEASLFDLDHKYADVLESGDIVREMELIRNC